MLLSNSKKMNRLVILIFFTITTIHCRSSIEMNSNRIDLVDSIVYKLMFDEVEACFVSKLDSVCFTKTSRNDSSSFIIKSNQKLFYVDGRVKGSYCIDDTLFHYSGKYYLDLPYGQFYIHKGQYSNQKIACNVIINKEPNKDEKKLSKSDWKKAQKRRKQTINFLEIVDTENKLVYASATRLSNKFGDFQYEVKISDKCPQKSKMIFRSALFMILWIYQSKQN